MRYNKKEHCYIYKGDLQKEIESCEREIAKKTEELKIWLSVLEKMRYEVDSRVKRINECKDFVRVAKEELEKEQKEKNNNE